MTNYLPGYDAWKTDMSGTPYDDRLPPDEIESECDCCGQMKYGCRDIIAYGMDTHGCTECLGDETD